MPRRFEAVVFDLFDTLVRWRPESLPLIELGGREVRSTLPLLLPALRDGLGDGFDLDAFVAVYHEVMEEIVETRRRDAVEITCEERFHRALQRLTPVPADPAAVAAELTRRHMAAVRAVTAAPPEYVEVVRRIQPFYRLGLLSNFDDSRTGREILDDTGIADLFETVVISADVALRKPHPDIFGIVLDRLGLAADRVLFVGDTPLEDVAGAAAAGMPMAWLADGKGPLPSHLGEPEFVLSSLTDLPSILELG
ncbi:MAG: putative hydrolase of the superfamily [Candidatus Binatota bacterium]|jgi:HAD superfamily hydrolase (TIGR01549 family)|nr:putative hydrolase of the superfamily [Candidatus Binatota bacterium]